MVTNPKPESTLAEIMEVIGPLCGWTYISKVGFAGEVPEAWRTASGYAPRLNIDYNDAHLVVEMLAERGLFRAFVDILIDELRPRMRFYKVETTYKSDVKRIMLANPEQILRAAFAAVNKEAENEIE